MRGHVRKRGNKWCVVFDLGRDPLTGKRKQKWLSGFRTKKEAEAALAEAIRQVQTGEFIEPAKQTVGEYMEHWLQIHAPNLSPRTYRRYSEAIRLYITPNIGSIPLSKLKPLHIQELYQKAGSKVSPATVLYVHRVLHIALKQAVKWQILPNNPCEAVDPPKPKRPQVQVLTEEEVKKLLLAVEGDVIFLPVYLAIVTGMRRGEICGLKWADIDLEGGVIHVQRTLQQINGTLIEKPTKTEKSNRSIALSKAMVEVLKKHKRKQIQEKLILGSAYLDNGFVCAWPDGRPLLPDYISRKFAQIVRKIGIKKIRFHDLRHTHATLLLKQGVHPKIVSERRGTVK
ncbi:MAG: hypothetical protein PWQ91_1031 [Eubacteriales bacterium]|nr:hypothetical protein [Eubacteriales bacterium]